jgi:hypothetical protein
MANVNNREQQWYWIVWWLAWPDSVLDMTGRTTGNRITKGVSKPIIFRVNTVTDGKILRCFCVDGDGEWKDG